MKLQGLIPVLSCQEIEPVLEFYQQAFRYIIINKTLSDNQLVWVHLKSDNTYLMLQKRQGEIPDQVTEKDKIMLYYYTDDIEAQYHFMVAKGIEVSPISVTDYKMKEFFLYDPAGNKLAVGQRMTD